MNIARFFWVLTLFCGMSVTKILGSASQTNPVVLSVNTTHIIKPVAVKFGSGIGSLHRGPGWPPVDFSDPELLNLLNVLNLGFVNLQYTHAPASIEHVFGLPFFRESTGDYSQRLSYAQIFEKMGINATSTGPEADLYALYTSSEPLAEGPITLNGIQYHTYEELLSLPPHKNYDDMLQFLEKLDSSPQVFIRIPTFFFTIIDDPFPRSTEGRVVIMRDLDPQSGADLVHYLNDPTTTGWGQLRSTNGHPEPYNVKYFMLGNEVWWPYTEFNLSTERIINQTVAFSQMMKEADPSIKIVFNPVNDVYPNSFLRLDDPEMEPIIQKMKKFNPEIIPETREFIDAVQFFQYGLAIGDGTVLPELDKEGWKYVMAHTSINEKYYNASRHRRIAMQYDLDTFQVPTKNKEVKNPSEISFSHGETAFIMGEYGGPPARLGGAIYDADYAIYLLNNSYDIFIANWNLGLIETNYYGLINQDVFHNRSPVRRPSFYVQKMFNNYFGDKIVASYLTNSPTFDVQTYDTGKFLLLPAEQDVPCLNAIATTRDELLFLMIVNRDLDRDIELNIELDGFIPQAKARVFILNGPTIDATNEENANHVIIRESKIDTLFPLIFTVEKHSVTVIEFVSN